MCKVKVMTGYTFFRSRYRDADLPQVWQASGDLLVLTSGQPAAQEIRQTKLSKLGTVLNLAVWKSAGWDSWETRGCGREREHPCFPFEKRCFVGWRVPNFRIFLRIFFTKLFQCKPFVFLFLSEKFRSVLRDFILGTWCFDWLVANRF